MDLLKGQKYLSRNIKTLKYFVSVCHSLSQGVAALFGPTSPFTAHHVQSICDSKEIPHIETRWDYRVGPIREQYSINLFPYPPTISKVSCPCLSCLAYINFTAKTWLELNTLKGYDTIRAGHLILSI